MDGVFSSCTYMHGSYKQYKLRPTMAWLITGWMEGCVGHLPRGPVPKGIKRWLSLKKKTNLWHLKSFKLKMNTKNSHTLTEEDPGLPPPTSKRVNPNENILWYNLTQG